MSEEKPTLTLGTFLNKNMERRTIAIKQDVLTTHAAILGMTGSGKTGMGIGVIEGLVANGIPSIIVDIKGDMANVAVQVDTELSNKMAVHVLTPGAFHGDSVDVFAGLEHPEKIDETVGALLRMIGVKNLNPLTSTEHSYLSNILKIRHAKNQRCNLLDLVYAVQDPPFRHLGAMEVDDVFGVRSRTALARKLNNVLTAPSFEAWRTGVPLELDSLLQARTDGKTPIVIYSVAHLVQDEERIFAISLLFHELQLWMRRNKGSDVLKTALFVDECAGIMPPTQNPPTKTPLLTMLKQGRAFGLGIILSTQNPMDIDYKGMANCQTWVVGRLQTKNDRARVIDGVVSSGTFGGDKDKLARTVGGLQPREFLLAHPKGTVTFNSRTVGAQLSGPMTSEDIANLYTRGLLEKVGH